jgi:hypothetical protein
MPDGNTLSPENQRNVTGQTSPAIPRGSAAVAQPAFIPYTGAELWLHRFNVLLFVFLCAAMGVLMFIVPWWPQWTDNYFLLGHPALRSMVSGGFARGLCSGLGVLDVWIGFSAAIHYREDRPV